MGVGQEAKMDNLKDYKIFANNQFEILTDEGFKDFKGIIVGKNKSKIILYFKGGKLLCTPKHKIMINNFQFKYANDLQINNLIFGNIKIENIEYIENDDLVYEILDVEDIHRYFANGILSSQCLIIDEMSSIPYNLVDEFWKSTIPVISSSKKAKIFAVSTPRGSGNKFYDVWTSAMRGENNWHPERVDWFEIPGRNEKWKKEMINSLGSKEFFDQEFGNCIDRKSLLKVINNYTYEEKEITIEELYNSL
jgi:hypothetical protein